MEPIIVLVGFLGAGKTTLLKRLIKDYVHSGWNPYVILNDYENASLDAQQFLDFLEPSQIQALSGSCICCTGENELRKQVASIPKREKGITLIEANGTTDAVTLMEFLGVGLQKHFLPPVQISVVDCRNWQTRGNYNDLEANQVQVSSLIILNHSKSIESKDLEKLKREILSINPSAVFKYWDDFRPLDLVDLGPSQNEARPMDHLKAHWSSCSVSLPDPLLSRDLKAIIDKLPKEILRVKGCTKLDKDDYYTYFEKIPGDTDAMVRPYRGTLISGPVILTVGPGSDPQVLGDIISQQVTIES